MSTRAGLTLCDADLLRECEVDTYRASGPGGQKRNKTDSAVRLRHGPTGVVAIAEESRSQHDNKRKALRRLRRAIALEVRLPVERDGFAPSETLAGCLSADGRLCVGRRDERWPIAVGEVLDLLDVCDAQVSEAADRLGVSTGNLVKFLEQDAHLWARVNRMRAGHGLKPLRLT